MIRKNKGKKKMQAEENAVQSATRVREQNKRSETS